jgi:hypothetical protein
VTACLVAAATAWRGRAVAGLLASALSAGGVAAAATGWAMASPALAIAAVFAVVSLGATAVGAAAGRLLDNEDDERQARR